ncbi:MAG: ABC transporter permease subunit [Alphaproteobacteria bacterium]|nr:ABC transporter permease subunit [Alphaproteobacteria bacterium]
MGGSPDMSLPALSRFASAATMQIVGAAGTLFAVSVIFFLLTDWLPGDFATATASRDTLIETIMNTQFELGLFRSASERYWEWLFNILQGNFGISWYTRIDILELIGNRFWHSMWLAAWATAVAVPIGVVLGVMSAAWQGSLFDRLINTSALTFVSIPDFVIAYALMALLGVHFKVFPVFVAYEPSLPLSERLMGTGLPVLSLAIVALTPILRLTRACIINILTAPFVEMAQLKGMGIGRVVVFHALPNAIGPIANAIVLVVGNLIVGLVIIETVFSYPGLGELLINAVKTRDVPLVQACGLITAAIYLVLNLSADLISIVSNPRLLYASPRQRAFSLTSIRTKWAWFLDLLRRPWGVPSAVAAVIALAWYFSPVNVENYAYPLDVPPAKPAPRAELTLTQLQGGSAPEMLHYDYFAPIGNAGPALHKLEGTISVPSFKVSRRMAEEQLATTSTQFPAFSSQVFAHENMLVPVERQRFLMDGNGSWRIILGIGRLWSEPGDKGWSRAAFPFTLVRRWGAASYNGVGTFLFNADTVSELRIQIAQEQIPWGRKHDAWGQSPFSYKPAVLNQIGQHRTAYENHQATRLKIRPWESLQKDYWNSLERFDGEYGRENITVSGLMVEDTVYVRACRTRAGPYPFCPQMRNSVYSVSKSIGAAAALFRLAQKYGPEVIEERVLDYVNIPTSHDGWKDVRFKHALNMTTGIGNRVPARVEEYVEVDNTALAASVWSARTVEDQLKAIGGFADYPWGPGEVFRYRTSDTTLLTIVMDRFLKSKEGPDANLWDMMNAEVYEPLGIENLPSRSTPGADKSTRTPNLGGGVLATIEDVLKIARLFQNQGKHNGQQILHEGLTKKAVATGSDRGIPTGWSYEDGSKSTYDLSFWLMPFEGRGGCKMRIPAMAGIGGNYVVLMPNNVIAFRFADGHDDAPGTWVSKHIREVADQVKGVCG